MIRINDNFQLLQGNYLFAEIARRVAAYQQSHPDNRLLKLGIGDVTRPLVPAVVRAMETAAADMARAETFRGYGPDYGYDFLREKIVKYDYAERGIDVSVDEVFVSDGAKSDCGNIGDIFGTDNKVAICDPVYTVYVDTNVMAGRAGAFESDRWNGLVYIPCTKENDFCPEPPAERADMIYLCFPNNPTGTMISREKLKRWVDYARENRAVILYDAAYEAFITGDYPRSIYEIEGARECAIEFRSFSKTAGFTGTRCGYTVVPKDLYGFDKNGERVSLNALWARRQSTKFNGVAYVVQRGAEAVYSDEGRAQVQENIRYYMDNAAVIRQGLQSAGFAVWGGENSPYVWAATPEGISSWEMFDRLLNECEVVTTPGAGFGPCGEGYIRLSALGGAEAAAEAVERIVKRFA